MPNYIQQNINTFKAFTLAEVLITLLIIGVVASIVIPSVLQDTQDAELKTAWKKAYSELEQTTRLVMMDNGGDLNNIYTDGNNIANTYLSYLSYQKKCTGYGSGTDKCWHGSFGTWKWLNGDPETAYGGPQASAILANGSFLFFYIQIIFVDVNGFKGPNTAGKDIYFIHVNYNSIKPFGVQGDGYENQCTETSSGRGCSAKYLYQ